VEWTRLQYKELNDLYSSPNIIWAIKSRIRWVGHMECRGYRKYVYRDLVGRPDGTRPLGRPRHRWNYNIKMNLHEVGWGGMDWIALAVDRDIWQALGNAIMTLRVPINVGNFLTS
jgi:hypothetical protein